MNTIVVKPQLQKRNNYTLENSLRDQNIQQQDSQGFPIADAIRSRFPPFELPLTTVLFPLLSTTAFVLLLKNNGEHISDLVIGFYLEEESFDSYSLVGNVDLF